MELNTQGIDLSNVKKLTLPEGAVRKLTSEEIAEFKKVMELAKNPPQPTAAQLEANKPYAQIWKDGKMVGEVYKGGSCMTVSNAIGMRLQSLFASTDDRDIRAVAIAKATGGTIKYV